MKLESFSALFLLLLLSLTHFSLAKRSSSSGKATSPKKTPPSRGNTNSNAGNRNNAAGSPKQGSYPPQSGRPGYPSGYPQQPGGGYPNRYPARGFPYGGGHAGHGGYGGGYINQNPNNKVLSPHYGGSFGYGGHGARGGSPFSHSVQAMGMRPSDRSRGFGRSAVVAAAGGAVVGMALGYGLGRFPRPPFSFHNRHEEYYYNHYMYKKYGAKSTDTNDYSRDYKYSQPPQTYDSYMDSCMKKTDILPAENQKQNNNPSATTTTTTTALASAPDTGSASNTTETNGTAADNSSTSAPSTPRPLNQPAVDPEPSASQGVSSAEDDDTVSIMEIGYPALIEQVKARRCVELYMVFSEKYLRPTNGAQRLETGWLGFAAVVTSTTLMLLNSNMLKLLH